MITFNRYLGGMVWVFDRNLVGFVYKIGNIWKGNESVNWVELDLFVATNNTHSTLKYTIIINKTTLKHTIYI